MTGVSLIELMKIWGELVECYHGVNGYGGDTAEIYAYRLMGYSPLVHSLDVKSELSLQTKEKIQTQAARDLYDICRLFWIEYGAYESLDIEINGESLFNWLRVIGYGFDHRAHVKITRKK